MPAPVRPNAYRVDGDVVYMDVSTKAHPGVVTAIDLADLATALDGLGRWYAHRTNGRPQIYARRSIITVAAGYQFLHRLLAQTDACPVVIHRDHDGLNNRRSNLLATSRDRQAAHARHAKAKRRGAFWDEDGQRWRAIIGSRGRLVHLGRFATEDDAARAYDAEALELFGDLARPNFKGAP